MGVFQGRGTDTDDAKKERGQQRLSEVAVRRTGNTKGYRAETHTKDLGKSHMETDYCRRLIKHIHAIHSEFKLSSSLRGG